MLQYYGRFLVSLCVTKVQHKEISYGDGVMHETDKTCCRRASELSKKATDVMKVKINSGYFHKRF